MEMTGEQLIPASQQHTWDALNDPEILKACVPGCDAIEKTADNEYLVLMVARVGPVSAKFKGKLALSDLDPPNSYSIAFEGQGGAAGFGKGGAQVRLAPEGDGTRLAYSVKASVGGKLAQIGSRLVDAAAKKIANDFFQAFNDKLSGAHAQPELAAHEEHQPGPVPPDPDMPTLPSATVAFFAAGALVAVAVCLLVLYG
ncbi:MAG TPA: carbon monoxide dehydrogenase subunit G [Burkholderiales bacterium]|nr:carbon monoxide dehydrogenase subunit G [Burkholderiales bacterium]